MSALSSAFNNTNKFNLTREQLYANYEEERQAKENNKLFKKPASHLALIDITDPFAGAEKEKWKGHYLSNIYHHRHNDIITKQERGLKWLLAAICQGIPYSSPDFQEYDMYEKRWAPIQAKGMKFLHTGVLRQHLMGNRIFGYRKSGKVTNTVVIKVTGREPAALAMVIVDRIHRKLGPVKNKATNKPSFVVSQSRGHTYPKNIDQDMGYRLYYCFNEYIDVRTVRATLGGLLDDLEGYGGFIDILPDGKTIEPIPFNLDSALHMYADIGGLFYSGKNKWDQLYTAKNDFILHNSFAEVFRYVKKAPPKHINPGQKEAIQKAFEPYEEVEPKKESYGLDSWSRSDPQPVEAPKKQTVFSKKLKMKRYRLKDRDKYKISQDVSYFEKTEHFPEYQLLAQVEKYISDSEVFQNYVSPYVASEARGKMNAMRICLLTFVDFYDAYIRNQHLRQTQNEEDMDEMVLNQKYAYPVERLKQFTHKSSRYKAPFYDVFLPLFSYKTDRHCSSMYHNSCCRFDLHSFGKTLEVMRGFKVDPRLVAAGSSFKIGSKRHFDHNITIIKKFDDHYYPYIYREYTIMRAKKASKKLRGKLKDHIQKYPGWYKPKLGRLVPGRLPF